MYNSARSRPASAVVASPKWWAGSRNIQIKWRYSPILSVLQMDAGAQCDVTSHCCIADRLCASLHRKAVAVVFLGKETEET